MAFPSIMIPGLPSLHLLLLASSTQALNPQPVGSALSSAQINSVNNLTTALNTSLQTSGLNLGAWPEHWPFAVFAMPENIWHVRYTFSHPGEPTTPTQRRLCMNSMPFHAIRDAGVNNPATRYISHAQQQWGWFWSLTLSHQLGNNVWPLAQLAWQQLSSIVTLQNYCRTLQAAIDVQHYLEPRTNFLSLATFTMTIAHTPPPPNNPWPPVESFPLTVPVPELDNVQMELQVTSRGGQDIARLGDPVMTKYQVIYLDDRIRELMPLNPNESFQPHVNPVLSPETLQIGLIVRANTRRCTNFTMLRILTVIRDLIHERGSTARDIELTDDGRWLATLQLRF